MLLEPKEVEITDGEGRKRKYIFSKFDAVSGREIVSQYPMTSLPKVGDYPANEQLMLKLMNFVALPYKAGEEPVRLKTIELINNHVGDWEALFTIEKEMMKYNCSFFRNGKISNFFDDLVRTFHSKLAEMLTK